MSLTIHTNDVVAVLLADGWHAVADHSFDCDAYELLLDPTLTAYCAAGDGRIAQGKESTGAGWVQPNGDEVCCPLSSILAVKIKRNSLSGKAVK